MAKKTGGFRNRYVAPLFGLRMAGGAAQLFAAAHLRQVRGVIEVGILKGLFTDQQPALMALQTGTISHLCPRLCAIGSGEVAGDHRERFILLGKPGSYSLGNVAINARNVFVRGMLPRIKVWFHDVAASAKLRPRGDFHSGKDRENEEADKP